MLFGVAVAYGGVLAHGAFGLFLSDAGATGDGGAAQFGGDDFALVVLRVLSEVTDPLAVDVAA